jgi:hypothetical protein
MRAFEHFVEHLNSLLRDFSRHTVTFRVTAAKPKNQNFHAMGQSGPDLFDQLRQKKPVRNNAVTSRASIA